jgi:hypothetical protein
MHLGGRAQCAGPGVNLAKLAGTCWTRTLSDEIVESISGEGEELR